jgi:hypothetical protein
VDFASRLFRHAPEQAVGRDLGQLAETGAPAPDPSVLQPSEASLAEDPPDLEDEEELRGLADLRAALRMVASGTATSVTICGFPDGHELLAVGRELAIEGIEVEPLIRRGGGGFDIRVRRVS